MFKSPSTTHSTSHPTKHQELAISNCDDGDHGMQLPMDSGGIVLQQTSLGWQRERESKQRNTLMKIDLINPKKRMTVFLKQIERAITANTTVKEPKDSVASKALRSIETGPR